MYTGVVCPRAVQHHVADTDQASVRGTARLPYRNRRQAGMEVFNHIDCVGVCHSSERGVSTAIAPKRRSRMPRTRSSESPARSPSVSVQRSACLIISSGKPYFSAYCAMSACVVRHHCRPFVIVHTIAVVPSSECRTSIYRIGSIRKRYCNHPYSCASTASLCNGACVAFIAIATRRNHLRCIKKRFA